MRMLAPMNARKPRHSAAIPQFQRAISRQTPSPNPHDHAFSRLITLSNCGVEPTPTRARRALSAPTNCSRDPRKYYVSTSRPFTSRTLPFPFEPWLSDLVSPGARRPRSDPRTRSRKARKYYVSTFRPFTPRTPSRPFDHCASGVPRAVVPGPWAFSIRPSCNPAQASKRPSHPHERPVNITFLHFVHLFLAPVLPLSSMGPFGFLGH